MCDERGKGTEKARIETNSERARKEEATRTCRRFSFSSSFPFFFTRRSGHGGSASGEGEDDWKHEGEGKGIVSGWTRAIPAFARTSLPRLPMRSGDGPSDDPTATSYFYPSSAIRSSPEDRSAPHWTARPFLLPTFSPQSRDASRRDTARATTQRADRDHRCRVTISPAPSIHLAAVHQFPTFARSLLRRSPNSAASLPARLGRRLLPTRSIQRPARSSTSSSHRVSRSIPMTPRLSPRPHHRSQQHSVVRDDIRVISTPRETLSAEDRARSPLLLVRSPTSTFHRRRHPSTCPPRPDSRARERSYASGRKREKKRRREERRSRPVRE